MKFKDQVDFVQQHVKKNKMRLYTTILATTMGCAFLIVLASIAFGLQGSFQKDILSDASLTKIEVYPKDEKTNVDIEKIKKIDGIAAVIDNHEIAYGLGFKALVHNQSASLNPSFTNFAETKLAKIPLSSGQYPTKEGEVIIGYNVGQFLAEKGDNKNEKTKRSSKQLIGEKIQVKWTDEKSKKAIVRTYTIAGVTKKPVREGLVDTNVLISNKELSPILDELKAILQKQYIKSEALFNTNIVYAKDLETVKQVNKELKKLGYSTYTVSERLDSMNTFFIALKAGLIFVGTIAVLIASIGIFNTMTMAVTERTREIGVMKAIGASPKLIQRLFVMESAYIGIIGTVIAVISSYIISYAANFIIPKILTAVTNENDFEERNIIFSSIPWELVVIASAISIGVAIISGWRPARKATKIDVIQALRQD